jgi:hypothetical protein
MLMNIQYTTYLVIIPVDRPASYPVEGPDDPVLYYLSKARMTSSYQSRALVPGGRVHTLKKALMALYISGRRPE